MQALPGTALLLQVHKPKTVVVETVLVIFVLVGDPLYMVFFRPYLVTIIKAFRGNV